MEIRPQSHTLDEQGIRISGGNRSSSVCAFNCVHEMLFCWYENWCDNNNAAALQTKKKQQKR